MVKKVQENKNNKKVNNSPMLKVGEVIKISPDGKTVVVLILSYNSNNICGKRVKRKKKFKCHNDNIEGLDIGRTVQIVQSIPISKTKHFRVIKIIN